MKPLEIGVCGWSIDRHDLVHGIEVAGGELGLRALQFGFFTEDAVRTADPGAIVRAAQAAGVALTSSFIAFEGEDYSSIDRIAETGGYAFDQAYAQRLALTRDVADVTAAVGCRALAAHIGTIPDDPASPVYRKLAERVAEVAELLAKRGLRLHIETGRESAETLQGFIESVNRPNVAVNFDPANFLVYGTDDPLAALAKLEGHIENVHVKDARRSARPGVDYGQAAPLGSGDVDTPEIIRKLRASGYDGPLLIECGGRDRGPEAVRAAVEYLRSLEPVSRS